MPKPRRILLICLAILLAAAAQATPAPPFPTSGKAVSTAAAVQTMERSPAPPPFVSSAKDWVAAPVNQKWRNYSGYSFRGLS
jgi:hypothetical protein